MSTEQDRALELPRGAEKTQMVRTMFDTIASRYDLVNSLMTFGLDHSWRRSTVHALMLAPDSLIGDVGCGTGGLADFARSTGHRAVGLDLSLAMLQAAPSHSRTLVQGDASALPIAAGSLDGVVSGFALRNFTDLAAVFDELARALRPAGRVALLEVGRPRAGLIKAGHRLWFEHGAPAIGALLSDERAYRYLPRSVEYLPNRDELTSMLDGAGFVDVAHRDLLGGVTQIITATRAGGSGLSSSRARSR